jgi:serine/threonine protein kinase
MRVGDYQLESKLGSGGFAEIYRCQNLVTGCMYAIKLDSELVQLDDELDRESLQPEEWRAYRALDFGRGIASEHGIPAVYETGMVPS